MAILDKFDRVSLGANWESPAFPAGVGDFAYVMSAGSDSIEVPPAAISTDYTSGIYIGQEFTYNKQFAEIELITSHDFSDQAGYLADYAPPVVILNLSKRATGKRACALFTFYANLYYYYNTTYPYDQDGPLYFHIAFLSDPTGQNFKLFRFIQWEGLFNTTVVPAGTRLRLERIGNTFYALLWSPDTESWHCLGSVYDDTLVNDPTYPGYRMYTTQTVEDTKSTNFRAGSSGDDFIIQGPSYKPGHQDTFGNRNKLESRLWYRGANDITYRLGDNDLADVGTFDNKNRNRFS